MKALFIGTLILALHIAVEGNGNRPRLKRQNVPQINIHVTAPLFTARLYDYGLNESDKMVPSAIDVGMRLELKNPVTFYGHKYNEIFILSNGGIGFDQNSRNYKRNTLRDSPMPLLISMWNRNDLRKGGQIFYREITVGRAIERGQSEIRYQYDLEVKPISMVIVTWLNMQPFGDKKLEIENTNIIQMALIHTDNGTFANFIYKQLAWSYNAEAGFTGGKGHGLFSLPWSGTENVVLLKEYGNTGIPGEWMFKVDGERIIRCKAGNKGDTCDENCAKNEWSHDCKECCHCSTGKCDPISGVCESSQCKKCWNGPPVCNKRDHTCPIQLKECGHNAIALENRDHCNDQPMACQCLSGFSGDGYNCTDIDECLEKSACADNALCVNTQGGFVCQCPSGFSTLASNKTVCVQDVHLTLNNTINLVNISANTTEKPAFLQQTVSTKTFSHKFFPVVTTDSTKHLSNGTTSFVLEDDGTNEKVPLESNDVINAVKFLPKETNSYLVYNLRKTIQIFGRPRDKISIWSTGLIALGSVQPVNPSNDLYHAKISGFAPLFDQIDLGQLSGNVFITESTDTVILTEVTRMIRNHSQTFGFLAEYLLTVTFQNVTSPTGKGFNTFELVLISGGNSLRENVTYAAFVYNKIDWLQSAKAMLLHEDPLLSFDLLGPEPDDIRQLDRLSNIAVSGEWVFRVDRANKLDFCLDAEMEPPLCDHRLEKAHSFTGIHKNAVESPVPNDTKTTTYFHPLINFIDNGETVLFPSFITLVPQLVTAKSLGPLTGTTTPTSTFSWNHTIMIKAIPAAVTLSPSTLHASEGFSLSETHDDITTESGLVVTRPILVTPAVAEGLPPDNSDVDLQTPGSNSAHDFDLPPLQLFTAGATTTKKSPKLPPVMLPTKPTKFGLPSKTPDLEPTQRGHKSHKAGHLADDDVDGLNSSGKLAIIIPAAIVGIWLLILFLIGAVVCIRKRAAKRRFTAKYDPSAAYLRSMTTNHPAAVALQQPQTKAHSNGYPTTSGVVSQPAYQNGHKDDRLTEMYHHGRPTSQSSYSEWNSSPQQQQYGYYNQSYYDSYPDVSRQSYRGHY